MHNERHQFDYQIYDNVADLDDADAALFTMAVKATGDAYAPYSKFRVGAAALLANGEVVTGGNQENASFPAGLCAEGVVMAAASARYPNVAIDAIAISYRSETVNSDQSLSPCGICRQSMQEYRNRSGKPMRLIMGAPAGKITVLHDATLLLPFAFTF